MGLIDFFKSQPKSVAIDVNLAEALFNTMTLSTKQPTTKEKKQIDILEKTITCRQDKLNRVIELCGSPSTPQQRYLLAITYSWSLATYRKQAIQFIKLYLQNPLYKDAYKNIHHSFADKDFSEDEEKNIHIGDMNKELGKAYEGEYEFEQALKCYMNAQKLMPHSPAPICSVGTILTKMNRLEDAKTLYKEARKSQYYKPVVFHSFGKAYKEDTFKTVIDTHLIEIQDKIDKGYVYRSRKPKE